MTYVRLRVGRVDEKQALEALQLRASLANPGDREAVLAHPDSIEIPESQLAEGLVFVAEQEGATVGFAAILPRADGNCELDGLFVEPMLWRRGYGRLLVDRCADEAKQRGAAALHVVGNPHAEAFYEASGFVTYGEERTRFGTGLLMRKPLD